MAWQDKSRYSRIIFILMVSLFLLNILLAIVVPFILIKNKEIFTFLFVIQSSVLIPITSFVFLLGLTDFIANYAKNKQRIPSKKDVEEGNKLIGRLIASSIGIVFLLVYLAYDTFSKPYDGPYMSTTMFILMVVVIIVAIIIGPFVGQIYGRLRHKKRI